MRSENQRCSLRESADNAIIVIDMSAFLFGLLHSRSGVVKPHQLSRGVVGPGASDRRGRSYIRSVTELGNMKKITININDQQEEQYCMYNISTPSRVI